MDQQLTFSAPPPVKRFEVKVPGPYTQIQKLGQGRFGAVHEIESFETHEHFAMKILHFGCEEDFEKNEHEITKLKNNQHRNVVRFVEVLEGDTAHFVVLELCRMSLADKLKELPPGTALDSIFVYRLMCDIMNGIVFLHERNEVYGDLKPENILISGDFGGVVGAGTMKTNNTAECGTMKYWSPEQFLLSTPVPSKASDMWAFGMIILELVSGKDWIISSNTVELAESVANFDVNKALEQTVMNGGLKTLLTLLLEKNPQERLSSTELVRSNRLASILGEETPLSLFRLEELQKLNERLSKVTPGSDCGPQQELKLDFKQDVDEASFIAEQRALFAENDLRLARERLQQAEMQIQFLQTHIRSLEHALNVATESERETRNILQEERRNFHDNQRRAKNTIERLESQTQRHTNSPSGLLLAPQSTTVASSRSPDVLNLDFSNHAHFKVSGNVISRANVGLDEEGEGVSSSVFLSDFLTGGIISIQITFLSLPERKEGRDVIVPDLFFGVMDALSPIPTPEARLGWSVRNSVAINSIYGSLNYNIPSSGHQHRYSECHNHLSGGNQVLMEIDLYSPRRTVQFFVNGQSGDSYISGLPSSIRAGFSVDLVGTRFRIDEISRPSRAKRIEKGMKEIKWKNAGR